MKKADLLANVPPKRISGKATGNLFYVNDQPVLEIDFDSTNGYGPVRHFVWKDHWAHYENTFWGQSRISWHRHCWETEQLGADIRTFLTLIGEERIYSIQSYESTVAYRRQSKRDSAKQKRIDARIAEITPPLPKGFTRWVRKNSKRCNYFYLLQETPKGKLIDRRFVTERRGDGDTEWVLITENVRGLGNLVGELWSEYYYGERFGEYGRTQTFWDHKCHGWAVDRKGLLYPGNLYEICTRMIGKSAYEALKTEAESGELINFGRMYNRYQTDNKAEKIVKSGYHALIDGWRKCNRNITLLDRSPRDGVNDMLLISKGRYRLLRSLNGDYGLIVAGCRYITRDIDKGEEPYFTDKEIIALNKVSGADRKIDIATIAADNNLPIIHLISLLKNSDKEALREYADYLDMAKEKRQNVHDEIIYRNKRWKEYHDKYIDDITAMKNRSRMAEVNRRFKGIKRDAEKNEIHFGWEYEDYIFTVPKRASDIVVEGTKQHHCVGASDTYMRQMNDGTSYIVFMRKKENPEKPYYTIEVTYTGEVRQSYAAYDRRPDSKTVDAVLKKWKQEVKKRAEVMI